MTYRNKRWRLLADVRVQGAFCVRIVIYWLACQFAMVATMLGIANLEAPGPGASSSVIHLITPALSVSFLLLPLALLDALVFTNHLAGPLLNFRRALGQLATTESAEQIHFREGDFYPDLAENFNRVRAKILQAQDQEDHAHEQEGVVGREPMTVHSS